MARERLQKLLAQAGIASRRTAEQLIAGGRVRLNGRIVTEPGTKADLRRDRIEVDGRRIVGERPAYYLLHKPREVVTTLADPEGRPTVADLLRNIPERVFPVGRLDFHTSGALLLTNDGDMTQALLHPRKHVPKTYIAKVSGELPLPALQALREGVTLDDGHRTRPSETFVVNGERGNTWLQITINEGKNRQIHRMLEAVGFMVMRLSRPSFAGLEVEGLRMGQWRALTQSEVAKLKRDYLNPSKREEANRKKEARWEQAERADVAIDEEEGEGAVAEAEESVEASPSSEPPRFVPPQPRVRFPAPSDQKPTRVPADRKQRTAPERGPARAARNAKPEPFRTAKSGPFRNAKPQPFRTERVDVRRGTKPAPFRTERIDVRRSAKPAPFRTERIDVRRSTKPAPFRSDRVDVRRGTKPEPLRTGKLDRSRPDRIEAPRKVERERFVTAAERRQATRNPKRPPEPGAKPEPLRTARTKRHRGSKPEPRTQMTEALRARANKLRTHLRRKRSSS